MYLQIRVGINEAFRRDGIMALEVEDAIIIAAGKGTRMLPASLYSPKEFLPLIDVPAIHHIISETLRAGIKRIHIVISEEKREYVEKLLSCKNESRPSSLTTENIKPILALIPNDLEYIIHVQEEQRGVGDAISCAISAVSGPCLVLLGDNLLLPPKISGYYEDFHAESSNASKELVNAYQEKGLAVAGITAVNEVSESKYGVVSVEDGFIVDIVEKPKFQGRVENMVLCGRYVFPPGLEKILKKKEITDLGEMQSIGVLMDYSRKEGLLGHFLGEYRWYDFGTPTSWLRAQIDHAKCRSDIDLES